LSQNPSLDLPNQEKNNTELFIDALYTKDKGGIGSRLSDQEISDLLEEGRILAKEK